MENRLPSSFKVCATCALWAGSRSTDAFGSYSVFEQNLTGKCCGGGFNQAQLNPMASCSKWQKWQALK
ncbi:MAG: hypothetical protein IKA12_01035 [Clostridia bacterium]|nr:hypothetical protein [Clostridia bacterium]